MGDGLRGGEWGPGKIQASGLAGMGPPASHELHWTEKQPWRQIEGLGLAGRTELFVLKGDEWLLQLKPGR